MRQETDLLTATARASASVENLNSRIDYTFGRTTALNVLLAETAYYPECAKTKYGTSPGSVITTPLTLRSHV